MDDTPLYNSRIIDLYIKLLRRKYPQVDVDNLLTASNIKPYEVADEGHWFTQKQVNLFYDRLVQTTGNPNIARQAGQFAASGEGLGFTKKYLLGLVGPANTFAAINKVSANFTRSCRYESKKISANKVEMIVTPYEGVDERSFQCENRIGFFEAFLMMFNYKIPEIDHPECIFTGGKSCRYIISWEKTTVSRIKSARNQIVLALLVCALFLAIFSSLTALSIMATVSMLALVSLSLVTKHLEINELQNALLNLKESSEELLEHVNVNYNNALMVNDVGLAISKYSETEKVLEKVIESLNKRLDYDLCLILLSNGDKTKLAFKIGFGYSNEQLEYMEENSYNLTSTDTDDLFVASFREQKPFLVSNFEELSPGHSEFSLGFAERIGLRSVVCCPIACEGESLGILAAGNLKRKKALVQSDMSLMMGIASVIGISMSNALHLEHERQITDQLRHSQKMEAVGQLAAGVAHEINNPIGFIASNLRTLNKYRVKLTEFLNLQTEKLSTVSEELRDELRHTKEKQKIDFVLEDTASLIAESLDGTERVQRIVQNLKGFSRLDDAGFKEADINKCLESTINIVWNEIKYKATLVRNYGSLPLIWCNSQQLNQVFMNLLINAAHAIVSHGEILLTTWVDDGYVNIGVADTGSGISKENLPRIFEPFFTTKEVGKGTGLGLSVSYDIVKKHQGEILVESTVGKGTTFTVHIPMRGNGRAKHRLRNVLEPI